jgi:hypothetical protein
VNRKSKSLFSLAGVTLTSFAAVAMLSFSQLSLQSKSEFCGNIEPVVIDHDLPVSHPTNKCAADHSQGVSWSEGFTGRSSAYLCHFIDLLALLSRVRN